VRLLLDANLSPRRVGKALRARGHNVLALAEERALEGLDDPDVLRLAAEDDRILVTRNSRDFAPLVREWAEAGRSHAGVILIWTLRHDQFAAIVTGIERQLDRYPEPKAWANLVVGI
jgi:predicted nuclease of predicted toxin-antitoxin system